MQPLTIPEIPECSVSDTSILYILTAVGYLYPPELNNGYDVRIYRTVSIKLAFRLYLSTGAGVSAGYTRWRYVAFIVVSEDLDGLAHRYV